MDGSDCPELARRFTRRSRPLRVALFSGNYNYTRDGANQALNRLVAYLQNFADAEVRVYSPTTRTPAFPPAGTLVPAPSIRIPGRSEYRLSLGLNRALRRDVARFGPDLVHLSAPDPLGLSALRLGRTLGVPVVASLHTRFESYLDYYGLGRLRGLVTRRLRAFYGACDYVLAPNAEIGRTLSDVNPRVRIWSRGVDRRQFSPARRDEAWRAGLGLAEEDVAVAFFGRIVPEKGLDMFAAALCRLVASHPQVRPLVIGDGPMRERFARVLPANAIFTGFLSGEALGRAIAGADILLHPSRTEAFGNVTLEAMAAGVAVVGADAASNRALIEDGETGLLCDAASPGACAAAVARLVEDEALRERIGRAARVASAEYEWDLVLSDVLAVYDEAAPRPACDGWRNLKIA